MSFINVETKGPVTWLTINRPESRNALTPDMHEDLQAAFDSFAGDDEQRICVITGAGDKAFCAGSDLKAGIGRAYPKNGYAGLVERFDLYKPVIAAVNGFALGGGFEIALATDIVIATETASFGLPEPLVGAVALGGGVHRLVRQIGQKRAMGMLLSAKRISAQEAFELGLVNELVSPGALEETVERWCEGMLKCAPLSLKATKEAAMRGLEEPSLAEAMRNQEAYPAFAAWRRSEDLQEGRQAFAEKRAPEWKGR